MAASFVEKMSEFNTIIDFLRFGFSCANKAELYYGHGADNAWDDILALVLGSLSLPHDLNPALLHARLTTDEKIHLAQQLDKRINQRIPVPYLTKEANFCGLPFYIDERALIPRSPFAELIEAEFSPWVDADNVTRVLDLCTGSACIAIACCYAFPEAMVDAVDISKDALAVAAINCQKHQVSDQLTLIESDCFDAIPKHKYDIIVSNPPYVGQDEMQTLPKEYQHEPVLALAAENNGLAIVEKILSCAHDYLNEKGVIIVEVGNSQDELVAKYPDIPFTWLEFEHGGEGVFLLTREDLKNWGN